MLKRALCLKIAQSAYTNIRSTKTAQQQNNQRKI